MSARTLLGDPALQVMSFLNEIVGRFPQAISFAPGRPHEAHFRVEDAVAEIQRYVEHRAACTGQPPAAIFDSLGQYGRTKGIIADLIAHHLAVDEGITADPESIVVTSGAQEAMTIALLGLFDPARDILLATEPSYIGITGMAAILGIEVVAVAAGDAGCEPAVLARAIEVARATGKRPRAFYDIPDFHNPLGVRTPLAARHGLLEVARAAGLVVLEDNAYGVFAYDGARLPSLRALASDGSVLYIGTFSKTLFPGLRIGFLVAGDAAQADAFATVKSLTTVNTSPILQAIAGGILLAANGSLVERCRDHVAFYRRNRDHMLGCLARSFGRDGVLRDVVRWNQPAGGFFLTVTLPFEFADEELARCAGDHGVIVCPMALFSKAPERRRQVRLSFSYVSLAQIEQGVTRLFAFVQDRVRCAA